MKTVEILYNLNPYQHLLDTLYQKESDNGIQLVKYLKCQYNFITLELKRKKDGVIVTKVEFELRKGKMVLNDTYVENISQKAALETLIRTNKQVHDAHWHTEPNNTWYHDNEVTCYVNIADEIAKVAVNYSIGDNYYPGYYSEILISDTSITLSQINLHNSRSIDHKSDYHMRKLIMTIPLTKNAATPFLPDYNIGDLQIKLSDNSSTNNKTCGKAILECIQNRIAGFETKK